MIRLRRALILCAALSACSAGQALNLLTGGGTNVAANVQAGANNVQGVQSDRTQAVRNVTGDVRQERTDRQVRAEQIETVVTHEYPIWLILAFVVAVLVDSPVRWIEQISAVFSRRR